MTLDTKLNLSEFQAVDKLPENLIQTPCFLEGKLGLAVFERYQELRQSIFNNNHNLKLQYENGVVTGSDLFDEILIDQIIREIQGNPRTPLPRDLGDQRILDMVEEKHYTGTRAAVLRSTKDSLYPKNEPLAEFLAEQEGIDLSRLEREPALIYGFTLQPWPKDRKGYGLKTVPNEEFTVLHDDRLLEKWNCYRFTKVDRIGLPEDLDETKGDRTWYTRKDGLSRLYLDRSLGLGSIRGDLDGSDSAGRVVVVSDAVAPENLAAYERLLNQERARQIEEATTPIENRYQKAIDVLRGKE